MARKRRPVLAGGWDLTFEPQKVYRADYQVRKFRINRIIRLPLLRETPFEMTRGGPTESADLSIFLELSSGTCCPR